VIVGTWEQHAHTLVKLIRQFGIDGQLIFNRAALMLLPSGINKAVGVRRALDELKRSERNLIAFGDAENDIPMLSSAEVGIAARDSVPAIAALADDAIAQPGGAGVALYIRGLMERQSTVPTPRRRTVTLGRNASGHAVTLPSAGCNLVISGDPRSGKSWIAGLLAEQLMESGYRICIVDPEGDYLQMAQRSSIIAFGHDLVLPAPAAVARLLASESLGVVLILATLAPAEQLTYVAQLLAALEETRNATGIPHWLMIDEAHYFFLSQSPCLKYLGSISGTFCLVTYRPSLLASEAYDTVGAHIFTQTEVEEERYFATKILQECPKLGVAAHTALDAIETPQAGLFMESCATSPWQVFSPAERITRHAHHARKYADSRLPEDKAFRFQSVEEPLTARNMGEFYRAIQEAPLPSLRHHLSAGDFSRWVEGVIGDQQLAKGLRKLERAILAGATPDRAEIQAHIKDHYLIQEDEAAEPTFSD
jgi:hypothetical protein